jgi:hypothetical protein
MNFRLTDYFKDRILRGENNKVQMIQIKDNVGYFFADLIIDTSYPKKNIIQINIDLRNNDGYKLAELDTVQLQPGESVTIKKLKILSEFRVE